MKIVKITAMWCSGCLIMNKIWNKVSEKRDLDIVSLDLDMDEEEALKYNPGDILPVVIFIKNGEEIERMVGEKKEEDIIKLLDRLGD